MPESSESQPDPTHDDAITPGALRTAVERASRTNGATSPSIAATNGTPPEPVAIHSESAVARGGAAPAPAPPPPNGLTNGVASGNLGSSADIEVRLAQLTTAVADLRADAARLQRSVDTILERLRMITG